MKDNLRKNPRVAIAFIAGALCSLIASASAQSDADAPIDPIFQAAPAVDTQTRVDVDDGSGGTPEATVVVPGSTDVQVQVQQAAAPAATDVQVQVQPQFPAQPLASDPAALQQLEQSINAQQPGASPTAPINDATGPIVRNNPAIMTPYTVPRAAEGIFEDSDLTLREIAFLTAEQDRLQAMTGRENAFATQIQARRAVMDALEAPTQAQLRAQDEAKEAREAARQDQIASPQASSAAAAAAAPQPFVNSIYSYDNKAYAEIFIGPNKVVATEGTVLVTGDRVISITPEGVIISGRKGRKTLRVIGTAGTSM